VLNDASTSASDAENQSCRHPPKNGQFKPVGTLNSEDSLLAFNEENRSKLSPNSCIRISPRRLFFSSTASIMVASGIFMTDNASFATEIPETSRPVQSGIAGPENVVSVGVMGTKIVENEKTSSPLMESVSGFVAGGALSFTKTIVKYPLDTATVRLQTNSAYYSVNKLGPLFDNSFRGILTPLVTNIPAGAVFFAVKDATKQALKERRGDASMPKWFSTSFAVAVAQIPYWLVRNPSEVVKTRQQAGIDGYGEDTNALEAIKKIWTDETPSGLYSGFWENVFYAYPADVIKFLCYESLSSGKRVLQPLEGSIYGALSTAVAQLVTTPLDVVRNRVMAQGFNELGSSEEDARSTRRSYLGSIINLAETEGLNGLFAGAAPRVGKALLSGAIQFATYEETKSSINKLFLTKKT